MKNFLLITLLFVALVSASGCLSTTGHVSERALLEDEMLESLINESLSGDNETEIIEELSREIESMPILNETEPHEIADLPEEPEPKDPCADISCPKIERKCPDGYRAKCQTACMQETGTCSFCTPDCSEHKACDESWSCTGWSECAESEQTRTCTDANSCGTYENKPSETRICEEPENTEPSLQVSLTTDNSTIVRGNPVTIITAVTDGSGPVEEAEVFVLLTYASGTTKENTSLTDEKGVFVWVKRIGGNAITGTFTVNSTAMKEGYVSGESYTTFEVIPAS